MTVFFGGLLIPECGGIERPATPEINAIPVVAVTKLSTIVCSLRRPL